MTSNSQLACNLALGVFVVVSVAAAAVMLANLPAPTPVLTAYTIEVIDGCEYLKFRTYQYDAITHKGNCKNH